jgi:hypothetical protein
MVPVSAQDPYFNFKAPSKYLSSGTEYDVTFFYSLKNTKPEEFMVVPKTTLGSVSIFNPKTKTWMQNGALRSGFPLLDKTLKLKIQSFTNNKLALCFEIQHIKTGKIFETPCKLYWNRKLIDDYLASLNSRLSVKPP